MKKLLIAMLIVLPFVSTTVLAAPADAERQATAQAVKDAAELQKSVQELGQMFGVESPKKAESQAAGAPQAQQKNIAAVMDKAIDKVSDVVGAMAKSINNIAPEVWRIMVKQQYAKAIGYLVVPFLAVLIFVGAFFAVKARHKYILQAKKDKANPEEVDDSEIELFRALKLVASVIIGFCGLWLANRIADAVLLLINPEFYAIQDLLRMLLSRGM